MAWSKYWDRSLQVDVLVLAISLLDHVVTRRQFIRRRLLLGSLNVPVGRRIANSYLRGHNYCCIQYIFSIMTWSKYWDRWLKIDRFRFPVTPLDHVIIHRRLTWHLLTPLDTSWHHVTALTSKQKEFFFVRTFKKQSVDFHKDIS